MERQGFACSCYYHAPELHGPGGCTVISFMGGPCDCKWDGVGDPDACIETKEGS